MLNETFFSLSVEHVSLSPNAHEDPTAASAGVALLMLLLFCLWQSKNTIKRELKITKKKCFSQARTLVLIICLVHFEPDRGTSFVNVLNDPAFL